MNIEFHYYTIYYLANKAGFSEDDSSIIAYSSQYVDSNIIPHTIKTVKGSYKTIVTQNYGWWDESFPKEVYIPFHFFPGDIDYPWAARKDNQKNPLNCTPNSSGVKKLLINALKTRNLYRVGIGLHTYADSWAHQNFSGSLENWNKIENDSIIPVIGHAQAITSPDNFTGEWIDPRLISPNMNVNNKDRFIAAAGKIYKYLCTYNKRPFDDVDLVLVFFTDLIGLRDNKSREERILDFIIETEMIKYNRKQWLSEAVFINGDPEEEDMFKGYHKLLWLKDAALYRSSLFSKKELAAKADFYSSHFFYWNEAAKAHLTAAKNILRDIL